MASKSNKSTTARVGSLTREGSEQDSKSRANSTLAQNQEGKETTQCEKELRECGSLANMLNRTMTREGIKGDNESMANMMLPENKLEIAASMLLPTASSVHQHIPTSKKSRQYCGSRVASAALIAERIAFTCEGLRDFLQELEHLKEKVFCILTIILWHCSFESLEGPYDILIVEFVIFLGGTLSLFSIEHLEYHSY